MMNINFLSSIPLSVTYALYFVNVHYDEKQRTASGSTSLSIYAYSGTMRGKFISGRQIPTMERLNIRPAYIADASRLATLMEQLGYPTEDLQMEERLKGI